MLRGTKMYKYIRNHPVESSYVCWLLVSLLVNGLLLVFSGGFGLVVKLFLLGFAMLNAALVPLAGACFAKAISSAKENNNLKAFGFSVLGIVLGAVAIVSEFFVFLILICQSGGLWFGLHRANLLTFVGEVYSVASFYTTMAEAGVLARAAICSAAYFIYVSGSAIYNAVFESAELVKRPEAPVFDTQSSKFAPPPPVYNVAAGADVSPPLQTETLTFRNVTI